MGSEEGSYYMSIKREELVPIKNSLVELLNFVHKLQTKEIPYFCRFLECMVNNLEICFLVQYDHWEQMDWLLKRDWNLANQQLIGIPGFVLSEERLARKLELECQFIELITRLESYLKNEES